MGVSLTHLVESRDLFFLEAEIVDNIFQWDALKNARQIKGYNDLFQVIRSLTVQKILKIRILSQNSSKVKAFLAFSQMLWFRLYSKGRYNHIHRTASFAQL